MYHLKIFNIDFWNVFEKLTILILGGFKLDEILPKILFIISVLLRLDLDGYNKSTILPKDIKNPKSLTNLNLDNSTNLK